MGDEAPEYRSWRDTRQEAERDCRAFLVARQSYDDVWIEHRWCTPAQRESTA